MSRTGRAALALLAGLALAALRASAVEPGSSPAPDGPPVAEPRPISDAEREAVRLAALYLASGPAPLWEALSARSPFRALGREEALVELAVRAGPHEKGRWSLRTPIDVPSSSLAIFSADTPAGLDQTLVFEMVSEQGAWKLHTIRTLAEPPRSALLRAAASDAPRPDAVPRALVVAAVAVLLALVLLPAAVVLRQAPVAAGAAAVLGIASLVVSWRAVAGWRASTSAGATKPEPAIVRLAALVPLRERLESSLSSPGNAAALESLPDNDPARDVAALWLAQSALSRMAFDEATALLKRLPSPATAPWADVLRARLAFLRGKETDAAVAYGSALETGPKHDGLMIEAHDIVELLGFDSERDRLLLELAKAGSREAGVAYATASHEAELERGDRAEAAFRVGWKLRPAERHVVLGLDGLWPVLRRPSLVRDLALGAPGEPSVPPPARSTRGPVALPPGAIAHVCGAALDVEIGDALLSVPGGAELAPDGVATDDAGAARRRAEAKALARLDAIGKRMTIGAFAQPAVREEILLTATALARRNRWRELASLTAGITGGEEQVPAELVLLRADALRRTNRAEMGKQVLLALAKSPGLEKRTLPAVVYRVGETLASFEEFDLAARFIEKGLKGSRRELAQERIRQIRSEQKLLTSQSVYPTEHFEIRFPPASPRETAIEAARVLELERARLSKQIPSPVMRPVDVQLLWVSEFRGTFAGGAPIVGLYDGRIRVPLAGVITWFPPLVSIMTHELAHAMIAQATEDRAPHWFQEGLAQHVEMRKYRPNHMGFLRESGRALAIPVLEEVLRGLPDWDLVGDAYDEADWMVRFLEMRHGSAGLRKMMEAYRDGLTTEEAFPRALGITMSDFTEAFFLWSEREAPKMLISDVTSYVNVGNEIRMSVPAKRDRPVPALEDGSFGRQ